MTNLIQKVTTTSEDIENENLQKLRGVFPQFVKDGAVDFDALQAFLKEEGVLAGVEKYGLSWAGKSKAFGDIRRPATSTLTPISSESKNWDTTGNIFIEGENLEVLKLLQKKYANPGKIKMIYIDPPYNTGKDFIYTDNFTENKNDYYERTGQGCGGIKLTSNLESNGRYHSDWLTMMYPRLFLARNLLRDDGVIFVSIDDNEVANLRMIMDEIFGEENFVAVFPWKKRTAKSDVPFGVSQDFEWILCYAKESFIAGLEQERKYYQTPDFPNDSWRLSDLTKQTSADERPNSAFDLIDPKTGKKYPFNPKRTWAITKETFQDYYDKGKVVFPGDYDFLKIKIPAYRVFESEDKAKALKKYGTEDSIKAVSTQLPKEVGMNEGGNEEMFDTFGGKLFSFPKPVSLIKYLLSIVNDSDNIVLDFFAGSGTTAHAVMDLNAEDGGNRKWICVQVPEGTGDDSEACKAGYKTISALSMERIRRAGAKIGKGDVGFKAFSLSPSNYSEWNVLTDKDDEKALLKQAKLFVEQPLVAGYNEQSVVYEVLLKEGFDLNAKVAEVKKGGIACYHITDGDKEMNITFAKKLTKEQIDSLELPKDTTFVCLDSALDDTTKVNIARNLMVKTI